MRIFLQRAHIQRGEKLMKKQIFLIVTFSFLAFAQNNKTNAATTSSTSAAKVYSQDATAALDDEITKKEPDLNLKAIRKALNDGANPNGKDVLGNPFIRNAYYIHPENLELLELLLQYGANPNNKDEFEGTPLNYACFSNNIEAAIPVVQLLLEHNADCNQPNALGELPLTRACLKDSPKMVELLLSYGANPIKALKQLDEPSVIFIRKHKKTRVARTLYFLSEEIRALLLKNLSDVDPEAKEFSILLAPQVPKKELPIVLDEKLLDEK